MSKPPTYLVNHYSLDQSKLIKNTKPRLLLVPLGIVTSEDGTNVTLSFDNQVFFHFKTIEEDLHNIPIKSIVSCSMSMFNSSLFTIAMSLWHTTYKVQLQGKIIPSWVILNILLPICSHGASKFTPEKFEELEHCIANHSFPTPTPPQSPSQS